MSHSRVRQGVAWPAWSAVRFEHGKLVLPGSAWVKIQSSTEEVDGGLEVLLVSVATGPPLDGHDLAVQPFGHAVGDRVAAVGQDVLEAVPGQVCHPSHRRQSAVGGA